jgi:hypothetical protein
MGPLISLPSFSLWRALLQHCPPPGAAARLPLCCRRLSTPSSHLTAAHVHAHLSAETNASRPRHHPCTTRSASALPPLLSARCRYRAAEAKACKGALECVVKSLKSYFTRHARCHTFCLPPPLPPSSSHHRPAATSHQSSHQESRWKRASTLSLSPNTESPENRCIHRIFTFPRRP